tara:strand:+ start:685 stop:957 length:273 start_codon:yes stop_codon:yes gene_type:complete
MNTPTDNYIQLYEQDLFKLDFIRTTIKGKVNREDVLRGLLDEGFAIAIWTQQRDGKLTPDALVYALDMVSEELRDVVLEKIDNPLASRNG